MLKRIRMKLLLTVMAGSFLVSCNDSSAGSGKKPRVDEPGYARYRKPQVVELHHKVTSETGRKRRSKSKDKVTRGAGVGMVAPDFELPAYHKGKFTNVKLSDYRGKWVLLCFYPGDFTFV